MVFWGEEMVTMVLWEKGRADYGILGRRDGDYGTLGEGKG